MRQFGIIISVLLLGFLLLLPNVYANSEPIVKQKERAADGEAERIVGGAIVPENERTFQVALVTEDRELYCGGAIIDDSWVMTAAHCVEGGWPLQILSGTKRLDQGGTLHSISESYTHPNYTGFVEDGFDIALIQINGTFPGNLERLKIATPSMMSNHGIPGTGAVVSGWGQTSGSGDMSNRLLQTVNHIISDTQCQEMAGWINSDTIICALDQAHSACFGDSGGPFTISRNGELYSAGIVSFGPYTCSEFSAYAETANLRDWISQYVNIDTGGEVQPGIYRISSVRSDLCMDVAGKSEDKGAPILQWYCHDNDNQKWQIEAVGENYRLVSVQSGQVLDVPHSSTEKNVGVIQWPWNGGDNQQWTITPVGNGSYEIMNVNSSLCLDVKYNSDRAGEIIQQYGCHGRDNQRWRLELVK